MGSKARRRSWFLFFVVLGVVFILRPKRHSTDPTSKDGILRTAQSGVPAAVEEKNSRPENPAVRLNEKLSSSRPNPVDLAAIQDGKAILTIPVPEHRMTMRALTNSGLSLDTAFGLLRPVLGHLYYVAACDGFLRRDDASELSELEKIRNGDFYKEDEKDGILLLTAVSHRRFRETWTGRKEKRMEEFFGFVNRLGIANPDELMRDLLLIQPQSPAPDPKPE